MIIESVILAAALLFLPDIGQAQTQKQKESECVATVRARSMSISKSQAEQICEGANSRIADCVVTKAQGAGSLRLEEMRDECDVQMSRRRDRVKIKAAREAEKKEIEAAAAKAKAKPSDEEDVDSDAGDKIVVPVPKDNEPHESVKPESKDNDAAFEEI